MRGVGRPLEFDEEEKAGVLLLSLRRQVLLPNETSQILIVFAFRLFQKAEVLTIVDDLRSDAKSGSAPGE